MDNFKIVGTVIDCGTDGRFGPGREAGFKAFVKSKGKAGKKLFDSLVERELIEIEKPGKKQAAPKASGEGDDALPTIPNTRGDGDSKDVETLSEETEESEDEAAENKEPEYTPTGKYEFDHYGGGNCHIVDPEGKIIDQVRPTAEAEKVVAKLNEEL